MEWRNEEFDLGKHVDPDGILLEFARWRRVMGQPGDVRHEPRTAPEHTGVRA